MALNDQTKIAIRATDETKSAVASAKAGFASLKSSAEEMQTALAGMGVGLSAGAFAAGIKDMIDFADSLQKMSQKVGVSVESLSALSYAGKLSDVSLEAIGTGMKKLSVHMQEAAAGTGEAKDAFRALGLSVKDSGGHLKSSDAMLAEIAEKFSGLNDGAGKTALAIKLFGKSGADLIPLLNAGAKGLQDMKDEAEKFGAIIGGSLAEKSEKFNDNLTRIKVSIDAMKVSMAGGVIDDLNNFALALVESSKAAGGFWKGLVLLGGDEATNPVAGLEKTEAAILALKKTRDEVANSFAASTPLARLPLLGTDSDLKDLDIQIKSLETKAKALRELAKQRGAFDFGPPVLPNPKTDAPIPKPIKDSLSDYDQLIRKIEEQAAVVKLSIGNTEKLTEAEKELAKLDADMGTGKVKLTETQRALVQMRLGDLHAMEKQADSSKQFTEQMKKEAEALQQLIDSTDWGKAMKAMNLEALAESALNAGKIDEKMFADIKRNIYGLKDDTKDSLADLQAAFEGWGKQSADAIVDFTMTGKTSFGDMANSIIRDLARMAVYKGITEPLFKSVGDVFGGWLKGLSGASTAGGDTSWLGNTSGLRLSASANGNVFSGAGISAFSSSVVSQPTLFPFAKGIGLMGEVGEEGILPLKRINGKLGVRADFGGGGGGVVVNVINNAGGTQSRAQQRQDAGGKTIVDVIVDTVKGSIVNDIGSGGVVAGALEKTYGVNRAAGAWR